MKKSFSEKEMTLLCNVSCSEVIDYSELQKKQSISMCQPIMLVWKTFKLALQKGGILVQKIKLP